MTTIPSAGGLIVPAQVNDVSATKAPATQPTDTQAASGDAHGPAYTVDLSAPGKKAAAPAAKGDGKDGPPPPPPAAGGGVSYSSVSADEASAKRKVIPQVGVVGADQVVDKKGNINHRLLDNLLAQQAAKKSTN